MNCMTVGSMTFMVMKIEGHFTVGLQTDLPPDGSLPDESVILGQGETPIIALMDYCIQKAMKADPELAALAAGRFMRKATGLDNWGSLVWVHIREKRREYGISEEKPFMDGQTPRDVFGDEVIDATED